VTFILEFIYIFEGLNFINSKEYEEEMMPSCTYGSSC